ncbi:MAG: hypothetical protein IPH88_13075 [Bacteroidales bacterium]|nr:hypothetical protein [Bacteroidales bacterium]
MQKLLANDEYVQSRVKELNSAIASNQEKSKSYLSAITRADKYYSATNYNKAMSEYKYAGMLKPAEEYPRKKIAEIQAKLSPLKQTPLDSLQLVTKDIIPEKAAEESLPDISKTYNTESDAATVVSKTASKTKTSLKKEDIEVSAKSEPKKQQPAIQKSEEIKIAEKLPAKETQPLNTAKKESEPVKTGPSASDIEYSKAIAFADQSYTEGNLSKALNGYKAALRYKSNDKYANEKIEKINSDLKDQENNLNSYKNLIANADKALQQKSYNEALGFYEKAIAVSPDQKYPGQQISMVKTLIGKQNAVEEKYRSIIETSDNSFQQKNFSQARKGYESALQIKPNEAYPKQKIAELNSLQDQASRNLDLYKETIADADAAYAKKDNATAIRLYTRANELFPKEVYPKQRLAAIKSGEEQLASRQAQYSQTIQSADMAAENKEYQQALKEYKSALALVPGDEYAKDRIAGVTSKLEELKVRQAEYTKKITAAEKAYAIKDYPTAIDQFSAASDLSPDNNYPKERMAAIQEIMSEEKEQLESRFTQFVMNADAAFDAGKYEESLNSYKSALKLKPSDNYSTKKVTELSSLLKNRATEIKAAYELAIKEGDEAYKAMKYEVAVTAFTKALEVKPGEVYPGQMIARIRKLLIENSIVDVMEEAFLLKDDAERKFSFKPIMVNQRRENYLLVRARATGTAQPKLYLNYGSNGLKNGGIVLKNLGHDFPSDLVINISSQDKWFREDNNWLSVYSENGDIEISAIRISVAPGNR